MDPSSPEVKNEWRHTSTSLICLYRGHRDDFTSVVKKRTNCIIFFFSVNFDRNICYIRTGDDVMCVPQGYERT